MPLYRRFAWRGNAGNEQPSRMVIYDTETIETVSSLVGRTTLQSLRCGVAGFWKRDGNCWNRTSLLEFHSPDEFWAGVYRYARKRESCWVYSHNAAFDFTVVRGWDELGKGKLRIQEPGRPYVPYGKTKPVVSRPFRGIAAIDGIPWILNVRSDRGPLQFVDTLNYIPCSLAKLAKWVGMRKDDLPRPDADISQWLSYCTNDVAILESAILRMLAMWSGCKLGNWQTTIGRLAYSSFRHLNPESGIVSHGDEPFSKDKVVTDEWRRTSSQLDAQEVARVERRAYFGGRTIVNFQGDIATDVDAWYDKQFRSGHAARPCLLGPVTVLDVNGLYPAIMRAGELPIEIIQSIRNPSYARACEWIEKFNCVADVEIESTDVTYPIRSNGRLRWCCGRFVTSMAGVELRKAITNNHAINISNLCIYRSGNPFSTFVDYWQGVKGRAGVEGNECGGILAKLIMNSLFGKLGQRKPTWTLDTKTPPMRQWGGFVKMDVRDNVLRKYRAIAGVVQKEGERRECGHTMTATAACITAGAREYMEAIRGELPPNSWLYQDTDSVFVLENGLELLRSQDRLHPHSLGSLKQVGVYSEMQIYAPKTYVADGKLTAAGLSGNAKPKSDGSYVQTVFERSGSIISRPADGSVRTWQTIYSLPSRAVASAFDENGWARPIVVKGGSLQDCTV